MDARKEASWATAVLTFFTCKSPYRKVREGLAKNAKKTFARLPGGICRCVD